MSDRLLRRAFIALHLTLVVVAIVQSGQALHHALPALAGHHNVAIFAGVQLLAGILFLVPRTMRISGIVLVVVFAHAALYQAVHGAFPGAALVYAAAALFVTLHGAAWSARVARPRPV